LWAQSVSMASIDKELNTKFTSEQQRLMMNMVYTATWFQNKTQKFLEPFGISGPQFNILRILRGAGEWVTMNTIKTRMVDKSPHTTRLVSKLLDKELVDRHRSETDRRVVNVIITEKGMKLLARIDEAGINEINFMDNITSDEALYASEVLDKLRG